jgi:plasmid stabilization system protein ParE
VAQDNNAKARLIKAENTHAANEDLREILAFFGAPSPTANDFNRDLFEAVDHIRRWPYTGHRRRDLTKRDVCFWYFAPYFVVFHVAPELLTIVAILHSSRHIARVLRKRL